MAKSKWVNQDKFKEFMTEKKEEAEKPDKIGGGLFLKWKNPVMGSQEHEKTYKVRLLPDKNGGFYKKYFYHFFKSGEQSNYVFCPKTHDINAFCPWCFVSQLLFQGNATDKKKAYNYVRKERFVSNVFISTDPRDVDIQDEKYKSTNTVRLYEFPATLEKLIKKEITDEEQGYGYSIFDPESGYDFIIKIKAKKPDQNGKIWPDYSLTAFSRISGSIATDELSVEDIMGKVYDLNEYFKNMDLSWDAHRKLLKIEELWEDVEDKFNQVLGLEENAKPVTETKADDDAPSLFNDDAPSSFNDGDLGKNDDKVVNSGDDLDEKALLEKLKNLGN